MTFSNSQTLYLHIENLNTPSERPRKTGENGAQCKFLSYLLQGPYSKLFKMN